MLHHITMDPHFLPGGQRDNYGGYYKVQMQVSVMVLGHQNIFL